MEKIVCFLIGHDDWVMTGAGVIPRSELYKKWLETNRKCLRCGKNLKP